MTGMASWRLVLAGLIGLAAPAWGQDVGSPARENLEQTLPKPAYSPYVGRDFPDAAVLRRHAPAHRVFDGCRRVRRPARAARRPTASPAASKVVSNTGQPVKLSRPLDFLVVTDHSDNMGFFPICSPASPISSPIRPAANGTT
jgi:hypothetical protein